jgi:hypothetical protein
MDISQRDTFKHLAGLSLRSRVCAYVSACACVHHLYSVKSVCMNQDTEGVFVGLLAQLIIVL